jgi:hypothetical protein
MNNKYIVGAVAGLVIGFGAGYFVPHGGAAQQAQPGQGQFSGRMGGGRGFGGAVAGQIVAADAQSITVKMQDGSTKIVLMSASTQVMKSVAGSVSDLTVGTTVIVAGSANSDGSVTAQSVQIRPAGQTGFSRPATSAPAQ